MAIEALAMASTDYGDFHKYVDDPSYTRPSDDPTTSVLEILDRVYHDKRLDGAFSTRGPSNAVKILLDHEAVLLEHWNSWSISNPVEQFRESQQAAVLLLVGTVPSDSSTYDFFLVHLLTTSHAVRVLLPLIPEKFHIPLVRQWWLLVLVTYIGQLRPRIDGGIVRDHELRGLGWADVEK